MRKAMPSCVVLVLVAAAVVMATPRPALAGPPSNDTEDGAVVVDTVPFVHTMDASEATAGGPRICSNLASLFYSFTPSVEERIQVDLLGSDYDTTLAVYRRNAAGDIRWARCNDDRFGLASGLRFRARPGTTYYFMVGRCCGNERRGGPGGGELILTVDRVPVEVPLGFTIELDDRGTADPATGLATLTFRLTCTARSVVYQHGTLRQVRQGLFVARGSWDAVAACGPDEVVEWPVEVDTETGIAFGPGPALVRLCCGYVSDGWRWVDRSLDTEAPIQLA